MSILPIQRPAMRRERHLNWSYRVLVIVGTLLICICFPDRPHQYRHATGADVDQRNAVERSRGAAATEARDVLRTLAESPDSVQARARFLYLFSIVFVKEEIRREPLLQTVPVEMLTRSHRFAKAGDAAFLEALMRTSRGWYGRSAEGGEALNEVLWENLAARPQLTLDVLVQLPPEIRAELIDEVYTAPVHDGFDFVSIAAGIRAASIPVGLERDAARILATAEELIPE